MFYESNVMLNNQKTLSEWIIESIKCGKKQKVQTKNGKLTQFSVPKSKNDAG